MAVLLAVAATRRRQGGATVTGQVVDGVSGLGLSDVRVQIQGQPGSVLTDARGHFTLAGIPPGAHVLTVSVVGFVMVRRDMDLGEGGSIYLVIPAHRRHRHLHRARRGHRRPVPARRARRARPAGARQRRLAEPARAGARRPGPRDAHPARRRRHRRPLLRVLRARQRLRAHRPGAGRRAQPVSQPQRAGRRGRRVDRDDQQRHPRVGVAPERQLPAAVRQPHRRADRDGAARGQPRPLAGARRAERVERVDRRRRARSAGTQGVVARCRRARAISISSSSRSPTTRPSRSASPTSRPSWSSTSRRATR